MGKKIHEQKHKNKKNCPLPLFNLQEAKGAGGLVGPLGEDSSAASSLLENNVSVSRVRNLLNFPGSRAHSGHGALARTIEGASDLIEGKTGGDRNKKSLDIQEKR